MFELTGEILWAVAFLFYLADSAIRVVPDTIVVRRPLGTFQPSFIRNPFGAFGRAYYVPNPLQPFSVCLTGPWRKGDGCRQMRVDEVRAINMAVDHILPLRVLSGAVFICCFALIPALAQFVGLTAALLPGIVLVYTLNGAQSLILVRQRRLYGWSGWQTFSACANFILCPPYGANVARHRILNRFSEHSAMDLAMGLDPEATRQMIAEEYLDDQPADDPTRTEARTNDQ